MSGTNVNDGLNQSWTRPDELLKLQRLRLKKKQLSRRLTTNAQNQRISDTDNKSELLETKLFNKRTNPFAKNIVSEAKKSKTDDDEALNEFISAPVAKIEQPANATVGSFAYDEQLFRQIQPKTVNDEQSLDEQKPRKLSNFLPMDWSIKTRIRFFCPTDLPATNLKTSQTASGLTSFVRCIDTSSSEHSNSSLNISPATRLNQSSYYWQHPHIPWLTLFPRNSKDNVGITIGERERAALATDWEHSFAGLFHLLRALQCPYFYLCANTFTVLFRAAGSVGSVELHALMTPSSRGMRQALRKEGIEFSMPFKQESAANKANKSMGNEETINDITELPDAAKDADGSREANDDDDETEEDWLESLGVAETEIRRIKAAHARIEKIKETLEDFTDASLLLIEGVECQSFFNFLLNAKSSIASIGRLAGVPPTLLAPVAFPKATLQHASMRSHKVRNEGVDYYSIEVKGLILPTFLQHACQLLTEQKQTFSLQIASNNATLAFTKATQKMLQNKSRTDEEIEEQQQQQKLIDNTADQIFLKGNLLDCGLMQHIITAMCRTDENAVDLMERVYYDQQHGFAWT